MKFFLIHGYLRRGDSQPRGQPRTRPARRRHRDDGTTPSVLAPSHHSPISSKSHTGRTAPPEPPPHFGRRPGRIRPPHANNTHNRPALEASTPAVQVSIRSNSPLSRRIQTADRNSPVHLDNAANIARYQIVPLQRPPIGPPGSSGVPVAGHAGRGSSAMRRRPVTTACGNQPRGF